MLVVEKIASVAQWVQIIRQGKEVTFKSDVAKNVIAYIKEYEDFDITISHRKNKTVIKIKP